MINEPSPDRVIVAPLAVEGILVLVKFILR